MIAGRPLYYDPRSPDFLEPAAEMKPICRVIGTADIKKVASRGFPLKENPATLALRNQRITYAYWSLAGQLSDLLARNSGPRVANWCTFAAWSSKTIGASINPADTHLLFPEVRIAEKRRRLVGLMQWASGRNHGAIFRSLATGNRFIFLEVATVIAEFIATFDTLPLSSERHARWDAYWATITTKIHELHQLDPSWVPTAGADTEMLRVALKLYFDALPSADRPSTTQAEVDRRSELILAANLQLGAYEQLRAEGYLVTSFAVRGERAFRRLLVRGSGRSRNPASRIAVRVYTRFVTRFLLAMILPNEVIKVGRPLKPPRNQQLQRADTLFRHEVQTIESPRLQAMLSRYDLDDFDASDGRVTRRGARNWIDYRHRMHYIANLFRAYHDDVSLLTAPVFTDERIATLNLREPTTDL